MIEFAWWWDKTMERWIGEGFPPGLGLEQSQQYFGLDESHFLLSSSPWTPEAQSHGAAVISGEREYEALKGQIFSDKIIETAVNDARRFKPRHEAGEISVRMWLDGFFWFPRRLLGIEPHLYAFYDQVDLLHRINRDLLEFNLKLLEAVLPVIHPDFVDLAEDMSYNHGPMLSRLMFNEFILPYYKKLTCYLKAKKLIVLVDSDGDVTEMIPWFMAGGIDGVNPLEAQAGIDIAGIRKKYPEFILLGGYNKLVMDKGEKAIRAEFERIFPVMRSGRYIPTVDHQTPPEVSLNDYKLFVKVFREYCERAVTRG
jgi:hypothetical protein